MHAEKTLYYGAQVFLNSVFQPLDVVGDGSSLLSFENRGTAHSSFEKLIDCNKYFIVPGFADVHVHLREPGFSVKETIKAGTMAAARGGYTAVCAMPNVNPAPDSLANLREMLAIIERDAAVQTLPYAAITVGQAGKGSLSEMEAMAPFVAGFSDDGRGVQNDELMQDAMNTARKLSLPIVAHCEDESLLLPGGCVHDGAYAEENGLAGISSASEWIQVERDIRLVRKTRCPYHICHISTKETVDLVRQAKAEGLPVTCETAPHYLVFCDEDLMDDGRFKMNPPIRSKEDRRSLVEGLCDGTIDVIATDHAPHTAEEKSKGLRGSLFGIAGLETAFPVLYSRLVKAGTITLEKLIYHMAVRPREIFNLRNPYEQGKPANFTVLDLKKQYKIDPQTFLSKGKSTPFAGMDVFGETVLTVCNGKIVYERMK
ncbi:MAG: dihydroorotase [Oscillospiraceae bacterium]|jgi:dihydroorotase|nr:dihydroorotase [Oscillospiraceae bacterium]